MRVKTPIVVMVGVVGLALFGVACGDDGDSSSEASGENAEFCNARVSFEAEFFADRPDREAINAILDDFEADAPAEIEDDVTVVADGLRENGGDAFEDPAFVESAASVDEYALDNCGFETVEVTGLDYSFEGIPDELEAGVVGFSFTNDGEEPHEMLVFRINDDVDASVDELVHLPERETIQMVELKAATFNEPGQTTYTFSDLEPGRYGAACFVETDEGIPHIDEGMQFEFEVT
jgi:hypothetical protein